MTTRVGVNLTWLIPGVVGGSEEATVGLLEAVLDHPDAPELVLFVTPGFVRAHPELSDRVECRAVADTRSMRRGGRVARIVAEHTWLPAAARSAGVDLLHHAGGTAPLPLPAGRSGPGRIPYTLTVHDLQPLHLPSNFSWVKRRYLTTMVGRSARGARRVAVPSEFVRLGVIDLGVSPGSIVVVPWCVSGDAPAAGPWGSSAPDDPHRLHEPPELGTVRRRLGIGPNYFVFPAITHPHKNHAMLLAAFDRFAATDPTVELVLTGGAGAAEDDVAAAWAAMRHPDLVHRLGRIERDDLVALIAGARALVYPSRYEGFGLPVLEAMQFGCPVVCSSSGSLREVAGSAATTVDPGDVEGWTAAMAELAGESSTRRHERIEAGLAQAATFSPSRTAAAALALWS